MTQSLATSLLVTLLGMALVFGAILLFWLFMSALSWLGSPRGNRNGPAGAGKVGDPDQEERALRRRAALAAVTVALARSERGGRDRFPCRRLLS